ncbi:putative nucleic-acid-binding protein containing a Zn-ribbon (plasmid) [Variovorax sp. SRS16]|uniref:Zn-ribbon domain-containing OB-fold protein n=1 Tax=Variovorax sp. SRS16 TaxID=282217 RepID=UPI00131839D5|nr:Zn-ribbon domain-containing OB-fold protein [Variovorax sp. SRS16]VTU45784.1 putative nucleic-acid-binding protein containing a Zn-ribbon [Variovorax sp. SRS16]
MNPENAAQASAPAQTDAQFQKHLDEGRFMIQRAVKSGRAFFYPRVAEPLTGDTALEWFEPSGRGIVYSTTVVRTKPPAESYNVALIDLEEGPRLTSKVVGIAAADVRIGMKVKARIEPGDKALLVFEPVEGGAA